MTAPTRGLRAELDALLGDLISDTEGTDLEGGTKTEGERAYQKEHVARKLRLLPSPMRAHLSTLRNPYMQQQVLDLVLDKAREDAERWAGEAQTRRDDHWAPLHEAVLRRVIRESWADPKYRGWFRGVRADVLGRAHLDRRKDDLYYADVAPVTIPYGPTWRARSDVGLGSTPALESLPEEVALAIASLITGRTTLDEDEVPHEFDEFGLGSDVDLLDAADSNGWRVLHLGAGPSTLAIAVDSLEAHLPSAATRIVEVDAYPWERETRCAEGPRMSWPSKPGPFDKTFDALVLTPPCPGVGVAAQLRGMYLNDGSRNELDPGRLGSNKWLQRIKEAFTAGHQTLRPNGLVVLYLPLGVRTSYEAAGKERKWGTTYVLDPKLDLFVGELDLEVVRTLEVEEVAPRPQPYVGMRRPPYKLVIARKGASHG